MNTPLKDRLTRLLELFLLCAVALAVLIPYYPWPNTLPSRDSGVFLYAGWRVLHGAVPYLQIWDHKPPLIYWVDALGLGFSGGAEWGVWLMELLSLAAAAWFGYRISKRLYGWRTGFFTAALWLLSAFYILASGNLTTEYTLPFQLALVWMFFGAEDGRNAGAGWRLFGVGVLSALIFFTRQNAIALPLSAALVYAILRLLKRDFRSLLRGALLMLAGALLVSLLICGYFALKGALSEFWQIAFRYNFLYAEDRSDADRFSALAQGFNQLSAVGLAQFGLMGWAGGLLTLLFWRGKLPEEERPVRWLLLLALPLEVYLVALTGRPRTPYFLTLLPVLMLNAGFSLRLFFTWFEQNAGEEGHWSRLAGSLALIASLLTLALISSADYGEILQNEQKPSSSLGIVRYIGKHSAPADTVLMWGANSEINFAARRASPSRYVYQTPLYDQSDPAGTLQFLNAVLESHPKLIVLKDGDRLSDFRFAYRDTQVAARMDQIKAAYRYQSKQPGWTVFSQTPLK